MNKIEIIKSKPHFTTEIFRTYESLPSNEILMISELIDNSIASATDNNFNRLPYNLNIEIFIDESNKDNRTITVMDNAKGFTFEELKEGLNLGRRNKKNGTSFYNKGLKQSAFWSGECLEIESLSENEKSYYSVTIDLEKMEQEQNGDVIYDIKCDPNIKNLLSPINGKKFDSGTIIKFKKLFNYRWNYNDLITKNKNYSENNLLFLLLGTKYEKLLKEENCLKIFIKWDTGDEKRTFEREIKHLSIKPDNFYEWARYTFEKDKRYINSGKDEFSSFNKFYNFLKEKFIEKFHKYLDEKISKNENPYNNLKLKEKILQNILDERRDFLWDESIEMEVIDDQKNKKIIYINGNMGLIKKSRNYEKDLSFKFVDWKGISFSQFNRKLIYPPNSFNNDENQMRAYQFVEDHPGQGMQPLTRIYGDFSFDSLWSNGVNIVKPDDNKRSFIWENNSSIDYKRIFFEDKLKKIFLNKYGPIAYAFHECQQEIDRHFSKNGNKEENIEISKEKMEIVSSGFDDNIFSIKEINENITAYIVNFDEINLKVYVELSDEMLYEDPILKSVNLGEDEIKIIVNINHTIWKPLLDITRKDDPTAIATIQKILVMIGLVELGYRSKINFSKENFFTIFNDIANRIKRKNG